MSKNISGVKISEELAFEITLDEDVHGNDKDKMFVRQGSTKGEYQIELCLDDHTTCLEDYSLDMLLSVTEMLRTACEHIEGFENENA